MTSHLHIRLMNICNFMHYSRSGTFFVSFHSQGNMQSPAYDTHLELHVGNVVLSWNRPDHRLVYLSLKPLDTSFRIH